MHLSDVKNKYIQLALLRTIGNIALVGNITSTMDCAALAGNGSVRKVLSYLYHMYLASQKKFHTVRKDCLN